jgi:hypothetical protein
MNASELAGAGEDIEPFVMCSVSQRDSRPPTVSASQRAFPFLVADASGARNEQS